jgi:hypothetical protein
LEEKQEENNVETQANEKGLIGGWDEIRDCKASPCSPRKPNPHQQQQGLDHHHGSGGGLRQRPNSL